MMVDTSDDWPPEGHGAALLCYRETTRSLIALEHRCKHLGDGVQRFQASDTRSMRGSISTPE